MVENFQFQQLSPFPNDLTTNSKNARKTQNTWFAFLIIYFNKKQFEVRHNLNSFERPHKWTEFVLLQSKHVAQNLEIFWNSWLVQRSVVTHTVCRQAIVQNPKDPCTSSPSMTWRGDTIVTHSVWPPYWPTRWLLKYKWRSWILFSNQKVFITYVSARVLSLHRHHKEYCWYDQPAQHRPWVRRRVVQVDIAREDYKKAIDPLTLPS